MQRFPMHDEAVDNIVENFPRQAERLGSTKGFHKDESTGKPQNPQHPSSHDDRHASSGSIAKQQFGPYLDGNDNGVDQSVERAKETGDVGLPHFSAAWNGVNGVVVASKEGLQSLNTGMIGIRHYEFHGLVSFRIQLSNHVQHFARVASRPQDDQCFAGLRPSLWRY